MANTYKNTCVIRIQDVMRSGDVMYSYGFPKWLIELFENHKS